MMPRLNLLIGVLLLAGCKPQAERELALANQQLSSEEAKLSELKKVADESMNNLGSRYDRFRSMEKLAFDWTMSHGLAGADQGARAVAAAEAAQKARHAAIDVLDIEIRNMSDWVKDHGTAVENVQAQDKVVAKARAHRDKLVAKQSRPQNAPETPDPEVVRTNEAAAHYDRLALRKSKAEILAALTQRGFELKEDEVEPSKDDLSRFTAYKRLLRITFSEHLGKNRITSIYVNTADADPTTREKMTELTAIVGAMLLRRTETETREIISQGNLDATNAGPNTPRMFGRLFGYSEGASILRLSPERLGYLLTFLPHPTVHRTN